MNLERLQRLEQEALLLIYKALRQSHNPVMLWSAGKDSTVLLHLVAKACSGRVPLAVVHIDTSFKPPQLLLFRDEMKARFSLNLHILKNVSALQARQTFPDQALTRMDCCKVLKTAPLMQLAQTGVDEKGRPDLIIVGLRGDEEGSRSKEKYCSLRDINGQWLPQNQGVDAPGLAVPNLLNGTHLRLHPLLDWTELDVWEYTARENLPVNPLYFSRGGYRYRSLGCLPCSGQIKSNATCVRDILMEMQSDLKSIPERAGRGQDSEDGGLETLRRGGYM